MIKTHLDFAKIRSHNGSQNEGFEELVCQLAHLDPPEGAATFTRKDGAGGDAGIECYWKLEDGSEHGWQAKYFDRKMTTSQWAQLDKSFKGALEKHPNLTKFFVALPFDRTDSRKKNSKGKRVKSFDDKWNEVVGNWQKLASKVGRNIEIIYWGAHEITTYLSTDSPRYTGRALFWFNEPTIGSRQFQQLCNRSKTVLGERYTPELNVELPIIKDFDGLGSNSNWWNKLKSIYREIRDKHSRFTQEFSSKFSFPKKSFEELTKSSEETLIKLRDAIENRNIADQTDDLRKEIEAIIKFENIFYDEYIKLNSTDPHGSLRGIFNSFFYEWHSLTDFLKSDAFQAALKRSALLYGEAGIGKSHTLCDISEHRNSCELPTVFLLGQHYEGGNPINLIKTELDLSSHRDGDVLGALDAAGEAARSKTLIIIDAINEGPKRDDWKHKIRRFLTEVQNYPNISLLLSCRSSYLRYILPDDFDNGVMVRVQHKGFRGFEHRAANIYLSKQGISKPSAPVLAPEFSNPLFLKTCCNALKARGETSFPKGLIGITRLFEFYVTSVESKIAKKKEYSPSEAIVRDSLMTFASKLFPDHLEGIPTTQARKLINSFDPDPQKGETLFKILMDEGILSEDISYSFNPPRPIIRFTYERFSDHFVADRIIEGRTKGDIEDLFKKGSPIDELLSQRNFYRLQGIYEALAIAIAERFKLELEDLLPEDAQITDWALEELFCHTVLWRTGDSITERTRELLNKCRVQSYTNHAIDILLQLSTEPNHPWNAEMLHRSLKAKALDERDYIWSTYLAICDYEEDDDQPESIVRTLIDWACLGDISDTEPERIRLCAITLMWFQTTPNRRVRDQAAKAIVRILVDHPSFLTFIIEEFSEVNDPYLSERLYGVTYGVLCHGEDESFQAEIASLVYKTVFANGEPPPNILLRDYARGILELALHRGILPQGIAPDTFRPPYKSNWPIENPSEAELDAITGDEYRSDIRSSLLGFSGDFGIYTMSCVHDWTPTPLSEPVPKAGYEFCEEFAEKHLTGVDKIRFLAISKPTESRKEENLQQAEFLKGLTDAQLEDNRKLYDEYRKERDAFFERISAKLSPEDKEYFRWLKGVDTKGPPAFSRKWAQRWICKRAYEFGWTEKLFKSFEETCSRRRSASRARPHMERMGKKYQWIAFYELLARLADNVHWIKQNYYDDDLDRYDGPWQLLKRNIDPTIWIRKNGEPNSFYNSTTTWWQNFRFNVETYAEFDDQEEFLWSESNIPDYTSSFCVRKNKGEPDWLVLKGHWYESQSDAIDKHLPRLNASFSINSIIVKSEDLEAAKKHLLIPDKKREYLSESELGSHIFYLEYPWHSTCPKSNWRDPEGSFRPLVPVKYFVPVTSYSLENAERDYSLEDHLNIHLPVKELIDGMDLQPVPKRFGLWKDQNNETIFLDPSIDEVGPSFSLVKRVEFEKWLESNALALIWLTYGEKQLWCSYGSKFYGRLTHRGTFNIINSNIEGTVSFEKLLGRDRMP